MTTDIATIERNGSGAALEQVVMAGDLKALKPAQRVAYYNEVCKSVGLNPLTRPFDYLLLNNKLTLYARKDCTDQLRETRGVSIYRLDKEQDGDLYVVTAYARNGHGREDTDIGAVATKGLQGEALANARMKAVTKAKRRTTLSICGLGWLDETEISSIPSARAVQVDTSTGEIIETGFTSAPQSPVPFQPEPQAPDEDAEEAAAAHVSGKGRGDSTADAVERNQRKAGIIAHKEWMSLHDLDAEDRNLSLHLLSVALGRDVESRKDLTGREWGKANHYLATLQPEQVIGIVSNYEQIKAVEQVEEPAPASA